MSSLEDKQYSFNWNNHMRHIRSSFAALLNDSVLVDVTLCCEGGRLFAHKVLLSMCSPYFRDVFKENPCPHPIVILKDVTCRVMQELLQFMYDGEVTVDYDDFNSFMKTAELLQICGLTEGVERGKEIQKWITRTDALRAQKGKRKTDGGTELGAVKKRKEVELESSTSVVKHADNTSECLNQENTTVDASNMPKIISVKDEGFLKEGDIEFVNEVRDPDTDADPLEEQMKTLPLGDAIQELDFKKVENLLDGKPSVSALHLHRCFSSTALPKPKKVSIVKKSSSTGKTTAHQYLCTICGKLFTHEKSYEQHKSVHAGRTKCPICDKILCRKYQLKIHLEKQHKDENISVDEIVPLLDTVKQKARGKCRYFGYFKCTQCDKQYGNEKSLQQHMWMHKGRTRCNICDKVLSRKYELKLHLKSTHGITNS